MNLALEERESVTMRGNDSLRLEVYLERSLGWLRMRVLWIPWVKRYGVFGGWGKAAGEVELLLVVNGLDINRSAET
jgi:hypothetical protein